MKGFEKRTTVRKREVQYTWRLKSLGLEIQSHPIMAIEGKNGYYLAPSEGQISGMRIRQGGI